MNTFQPFSIEAEQSLLGALLLDPKRWDLIADMVGEEDFYRADHRLIFAHIRRLMEVSKPVDVVTVFESIEQAGEADKAGGIAYLGEIANTTPSPTSIERYAEIVRERAILRRLMAAGQEIYASATRSGRRPNVVAA